MEILKYAVFFLIGVLISSVLFSAVNRKGAESKLPEEISSQLSFSSEKKIPIVAVDSQRGAGVIGSLSVRLIPGEANVLVDTLPFLQTDLQYSANLAVAAARNEARDRGDNDFILDYDMSSQVVGGESAGAATALAAMAALERKTIRDDFVITGTIDEDGNIGSVAGLLEKAKAVSDAGYSIFLVPEGQSKVTYYDQELTRTSGRSGRTFYSRQYVPREVDIAAEAEGWGLKVIEVGTLEEASKYAFL